MRHRFNLIDVKPCHKAIPPPFRTLAPNPRPGPVPTARNPPADSARQPASGPNHLRRGPPPSGRRLLPPQPGASRPDGHCLDRLHRHQARAHAGRNPRRSARCTRPRPGHDPRQAPRYQAGIHRRRRRHERQPRLHRQQASRLPLLPHRPVRQGSHRRHHPHCPDARSQRHARQHPVGLGITTVSRPHTRRHAPVLRAA